MKNLRNIFAVGALALTFAACGNGADKAEENKDAATNEAATTETADNAAKTGTATAAGYGGDIKLTVTMEGETIKDIVVDEHSETEGIGADALPELVEAAKSANSAEIDNVSGATVTSEAFKSALTEAIANAK